MKLYHIVSMAAIAASFVACEKTPEVPGENKALSPAENKTQLEEIAKEAADLFNPIDQKAKVDFLIAAADAVMDLGAPVEWEGIEEWDYISGNPSYVIRQIADAASRGDYGSMSIWTQKYNIKYNDLKGEYTANGYEWRKTKSSDDIVFKFFCKGDNCEMRIKGSGDNQNLDLELVEQGSTWRDEYYITYQAPSHLVATIKQGDNTVCTADASYTLDQNKGKYTAKAKITFANIEASGELNATNSSVTYTASSKVGGKDFVKSSASVTGSDLVNIDKYKYLYNSDDEYGVNVASQMFTSGEAEVNVINKLSLKSKITDTKKFINTAVKLDDCFSSYSYATKTQAIAACQNVCDNFNSSLESGFYYGNGKTAQGTLVFKPAEVDYSWDDSSFHYHCTPMLKFAEDGSVFTFDDYFNEIDFSSTVSTYKNLLDAYSRIFE